MTGANLTAADLINVIGADFTGAKNVPAKYLIKGWARLLYNIKKLDLENGNADGISAQSRSKLEKKLPNQTSQATR